MRRLRRVVLLSPFVILLWSVVAALGVEAYLAFHANQVPKTNRYVKAMPYRGFCPDLDADGTPLSSDDGIVALPMPPVRPDTDNFGAFFLRLGREDRDLCARLRNAIIAVVQKDAPPEVFGEPSGVQIVTELLSARDGTAQTESSRLVQESIHNWLNATEIGSVVLDTSEGRRLELIGYPAVANAASLCVVLCRDITGWLSLTESQQRQDASNSRWVVPFFEYRKNIDLGPRWRSNNKGFRDDDIVLPKPGDVYRIACIGGSTTEEGRINDETYPNRLEKLLNEHFRGSPRIDVVNCGIVGLTSAGELQRTLEFIALEPDLVIEYNGVNDICHSILFGWRDNATSWHRFVRNLHVVRRFCPRMTLPGQKDIDARLEQESIARLRTMHEVFAAHGIQMAICSFASPYLKSLRREERDFFEWEFYTNWQGKYFGMAAYRHMVESYNRLVRELCQKTGAIYLPVAEELDDGTEIFGDVCHLRPKGIQRKAEILSRQLMPIIEKATLGGRK